MVRCSCGLAAAAILVLVVGCCQASGPIPTRPEKWDRTVHVTLKREFNTNGELKKIFEHVEGPPPEPVQRYTRSEPVSDSAPHPPLTLGFGYWSNETNDNGWNFLQIETIDGVGTDSDQVYTAGLIEGELSRDAIQQYWTNTIGTGFCGTDQTYCNRLNDTLKRNLAAVQEFVVLWRTPEPYWHQVGLVLEQIAGLDDGYNGKTLGPTLEIDPFGMYLLNLFGDLEDLNIMLNRTEESVHSILPPRSLIQGTGRCSGLIKLLPNNADLYVSQVSWNAYQAMTRIVKFYKIPVGISARGTAEVVPGHTVSMSSYPGTLFSGDDFYILSSGLVVQETTIGNGNMELFRQQYEILDQSVWEFIRNLVANRLARTGAQWAELFGIRNSGTYNNQFMIVDYNKFVPFAPELQDGLLTILEQIPMVIRTSDQTKTLRRQAYWPSYNLPFDDFIFNVSGVAESVRQFGDWFSYELHPRAKIFRRDQDKVTDLKSMIRLMRYNDFKNDPESRCNCTPPYSAENAIAARNDLNDPAGTYPFHALGHRGHGAIDAKLTSAALMKTYQLIAVGGPTWDTQPPFQWSTSGDLNATLTHVGQPDLWKFDPVQVSWTGLARHSSSSSNLVCE